MKKSHLLTTAICCALATGLLPAQVAAQAVIASIRVNVEPTKADGSAWDVGGAPPDVGLCVTRPGQAQHCEPSRCDDQYECLFENVTWEPGASVLVVDFDMFSGNDIVGSGVCAPDSECILGRARVYVMPPAPASPPTSVCTATRPRRPAMDDLAAALAALDLSGAAGVCNDGSSSSATASDVSSAIFQCVLSTDSSWLDIVSTSASWGTCHIVVEGGAVAGNRWLRVTVEGRGEDYQVAAATRRGGVWTRVCSTFAPYVADFCDPSLLPSGGRIEGCDITYEQYSALAPDERRFLCGVR